MSGATKGDPLKGIFKYYQVSIAAATLPGYGRLDPLAVVYTGGAGKNTELGRTRALPNQWNPAFPEVFFFPADSPAQEAAHIRVDFYNKKVSQDRFLGTATCQLSHAVANRGAPLALPFMLAETGEAHHAARVTISAVLAYNKPGNDASAPVQLRLEMEQTNYYGVSKNAFFEIARAGGDGATWTTVCTSDIRGVDPQGWCQFPPVKTTLRQVAMDQPGTPLLFSIYRHKTLGRSKRLLGHFQASIQELVAANASTLLPFTGNSKEDLLAANVRVEHASLSGAQYEIVLKLVNVRWRADEIPPPAPAE